MRDQIERLEKQRRGLAVSATLLAACCLGLGTWTWLTQSALLEARALSEEQRNRLELGMRDSEAQLASAQSELEKTREQIKALVDQRIPGLRIIQLDRPIRIEEDFVREIAFEERPKQEGLEYKVVVENTSASLIEPSLSVRVFDNVGVQLGHSTPIAATGDEPEMLRAGEIRSYFATVDSEVPGTPVYFRLDSEDRARSGRALPHVSAGAASP